MRHLSTIPNKLISEKSPYLLQHAYNPVNWYPWCEEAFEKAKSEDKPILLSVGYSTCHWCHVMAHESFEDEEIAEILNAHFISIKVDREERPDVDAVYMEVCHMVTGSGGWPMTILMGFDQKPFFAGTYLPKHSQYGTLGLIDLLSQVTQLWKTNRVKLWSVADEIMEHLNKEEAGKSGTASQEMIETAIAQYQKTYDSKWGGFGSTPKFPSAHNLLFLLRSAVFSGKTKAQQMAEHTLKAMGKGGYLIRLAADFAAARMLTVKEKRANIICLLNRR